MLLNSFFELSASRGASFGGPLPIAISEVLAYCVMTGLTDIDDRMEFFSLIQALDEVYLQEKLKKT